jgi:erythronate-4-phosphate dehydrogenase
MKKIVIDRHIPFLQGVLEPFFEVVYAESIDAAAVRDADALLIRTRTRCDAALLDGSAVRFIGTATIGVDHIDLDYCRTRGIAVAAAPGCNARAVMQYLASALVHLARRQDWRPEDKTLGVVGVGHVGSLVAQLGRDCGFRVVCCDPPRMRQEPSLDYLPLNRLLARADIVTCHVPLEREGVDRTLGMADTAFFAAMRPAGVFINTSRGEVVDERALKAAIRSGKLSAAVLDVWSGEPAIDPALAAAVTFGTTHIAGYSVQGKARASSMVMQALAETFDLPLRAWYPEGVPPQITDRRVDWPMLGRTIDERFDIAAEDARLRGHTADFEKLRNNYHYREEYF